MSGFVSAGGYGGCRTDARELRYCRIASGRRLGRAMRMVISTERSWSPSRPSSAPSPRDEDVSLGGMDLSTAAAASPLPVVETEDEAGWCFGEESVKAAIAAVGRGEMVVVTDNADRENEGDLIMAGDHITSQDVAFMLRHTSGVICASIPGSTADRLQLGPMVPSNTDPKKTAFTVSCDYRHGITTGISAEDRARTLRALASPDASADDFYRPGHIFPLRYHENGVLKREGHTEAALDLCSLAGRAPVGVLVEIVDHSDGDGAMARRPYLEVFAKEHGLVMTSVADLIQYRRHHETHVLQMGTRSARMPTKFGTFHAYAFRSHLDGAEHLALVRGGPFTSEDEVTVRIEVESVVGHVFGQDGLVLDRALQLINEEEKGCLVYLRGGNGDDTQLARELQSLGSPAPIPRELYQTAAQILSALSISRLRLLTNKPAKGNILKGFGLTVTECIALPTS